MPTTVIDPDGKRRTVHRFADWSDAYDCCRERGTPIVAIVGDEEAKIFPSGRFEPLNAAAALAQEQGK